MTIVKVCKLGKISYESGLKLQRFLANEHLNDKVASNTILLLEHTPVYTIGIRTAQYNESEEKRLRDLGADFYRTNRGGLITFHGPGQLIAYPILNLKFFKLTMKCYVASLEKSVINLCKNLNLDAYTCEHTGVWIDDKKVCAIGVHGSRYITTHGLALNCSVDVLHWFKHIIPCGLEGKGVTSLSYELKKNYSVDEAAELFIKNFCDTFKCNHVNIDKEETACMINKIERC
ncbi:hypothetical protein HHI36_000115 [Cryptolaemus montrouzieri]|uniref:Octanoyl-[acyl-carrier-protein]:protein N-octanoyltransferase LIPT2, mitochondrial n=1 Tax=Cryptolaemus montrouzieri TaxID=559131 RepID=A0ABD2P434_9CUCU